MEILWKKYSLNNQDVVQFVFHISSRESFDTELACPSVVQDMPEAPSDDTVLLKIQGNRMNIHLEWIIVGHLSSVVDNSNIATAQEQFNFLNTVYEPVGILGNKYEIEIPNIVPVFKKICTLDYLKMVQTKQEPITYRATANLTVGKAGGQI